MASDFENFYQKRQQHFADQQKKRQIGQERAARAVEMGKQAIKGIIAQGRQNKIEQDAVNSAKDRIAQSLMSQGVENFKKPEKIKQNLGNIVKARKEAQAEYDAQFTPLPSYGKRISQYAEDSPGPKWIGKAIGTIEATKPFIALRQALGTQLESEKKYKPIGGVSGFIGGLMSGYGSGVPSGGAYNIAMGTAEKLAPKLMANAAGKLGVKIGAGGTEGFTQGVAQQLIVNPDSSPEELLKAGALGAGFGGAIPLGGAIGKGIGKGAAKGAQTGLKGVLRPTMDSIAEQSRAIQEVMKEPLALPEPKGARRLREVEAERLARSQEVGEVIHIPETGPRGLPAPRETPFTQTLESLRGTPALPPPSPPRVRGRINTAEPPEVINVPERGPRGLPEPSPEVAQRVRQQDDALREINEIDDMLKQMDTDRLQAVNDEYARLKEQRDQHYPQQQGGLIFDEYGNVQDAFPNVSTKPDWLYQFGKENNYRRPSNKQLYEIANRHIDEGFVDGGYQIPSWKADNMFDETISDLRKVRDELSQYLEPEGPHFSQTDALLKESALKFNRPKTRAEQLKARVEQAPPEVSPEAPPAPVQAPTRTMPGPAITSTWTRIKGRVGEAQEAPQEALQAPPLTAREQAIINHIKESPDISDKDLKEIYRLRDSDVKRLRGAAKGEQVEAPELSLRDKSIVDYLRSNPEATNDEVAEIFRTKPNRINKLREEAKKPAQAPEEPAPAPTPEEAPAPDTPEKPPVKVPWFLRLFGYDNNIGFTPFGSKKSNRVTTTEQQIVDNPLKSNVSGAVDTAKQAARSAYQAQVDFLDPLKEISPETYAAGMDANRAGALAKQTIYDKFVDNEGNVVGGSLNDITEQARGLGKKLDDYLVLRHALTRMKREEKVYDDALEMTPEKVQENIDKLLARYPQLEKIGNDWDTFHDNMLKEGVKEGLITPEEYKIMREMNPNYASMRRQFTVGEKLSMPKWKGSGAAFSGQDAPIHEVSPTGSTRRIVSPLRSAVEQVAAWKNAAMRNRVMQEVVNAIKANPEGMQGIAEIVKKPSQTMKSFKEALQKGGSEAFLENLDDDFKSLFAKSGEENVVRAMVDGEPVYIRVHNPEIVKALVGMGADQSGYVLGAINKLSRATKRGATGLFAPMFAIKNLTSDTVQAAIQSPNAAKHLFVDLPHAFISSILEKVPGAGNLAKEYQRAGGEYSALLFGDRPLNKSVSKLRKEAYLSPQGVAKGVIGAVKSPFKALEKVSDVTENLNRMAAFRRAMKGKERTPENVRNAINAARESTVNYSRKGSMYKETEGLIPYSNAATQGLYRMAKNFSDPKTAAKTIAGIGTLIVAPKLYEYARFKDDPDYQNLPARERYRNVFINKNENGTFTKMPMPPEYEALGGLMTDTLHYMDSKDPEAFKGTWDALANAWTPPAVGGALQGITQKTGAEGSLAGLAGSTVLAPFVSVLSNKSFTGAPIVPQNIEDRSTKNEYDERTSSWAKKIGEKIGMSPMKVDYLLRAYGGDPARLLLPLTSQIGGGRTKETLLKSFISDPVFTNTLSNDYYDAKTKYTEATKDYADVDAEFPGWYSKDIAKELTATGDNSISGQLKALKDKKKEIQTSDYLSKKAKAEQLRDVQAQMNSIYADVNERLLKSGYKFPSR